jgi:curved DNA-binding protein CbpA
MNDPYDVLGLSMHAGETEIRQRYLELVRAHPPDREPERFAAVHAAYEALRDPAERLKNQIFGFDTKHDSVEAIALELRRRMLDARLPLQTLLGLAEAP